MIRLFLLCKFRLCTATKVAQQTLQEVLCASDCALVVHSGEDLKLLVKQFAVSATSFGRIASLRNTIIMYRSSIGRSKLLLVHEFTYLRSILHDHISNGKVVSHIQKTIVTFNGFAKQVWSQCGVNLPNKLKLHKAGVLTLLYRCEN